jgi:hypothetical protein
MRPARSPKAGARSGDAAAASHFRRKRPFACGGPSRARCARARPRASGGGWAPKPRPPGDGREPWRSPALTRQSRVRAHARPDGANAESRPGSAPSRSRNRSRSLSSGQRDSRRPVRQRAGESGSQAAPHAELKPTVVGENASPQKLAFFFWYPGACVMRSRRASRTRFSHQAPFA